MNNKQLNPSELNAISKMAKEFNYSGDENEMYYIGQDGEFDFGGEQNSFAGEHRTGRGYSLKITNNVAEDVDVVICPAFFDTKARMATHGFASVGGILTDGTITTIGGLTVVGSATDSTKTIYSLLEFIKRNPTRVTGMTMSSNVQAQFEKTIRIENVSPIRNLGNRTIYLTDYLDTAQLITNKISADLLSRNEVIELNDQNVVILTVAASSILTINLKFGAIANTAGKLSEKAGAAHKNIAKHVASRMRRG